MQGAWLREPTRGQWITFFAAWAGWVLDAFDFTIFLLLMPNIAKHFGVSDAATAFVVTLTLLTRLCGGVVAGAVADRIGRKLPLLVSIAWLALCDGAIAFAPSFGWVVALRVLFGFGMGAEWTSGTTLAMENWPERSRGIASGVLQGSWALGFLAAAHVTRVVVPSHGWRALFLIAAAPAVLVLPLRFLIPESRPGAERSAAAPSAQPSLRDLATPALLRKLLWAGATMSLGLAAYYAFTGNYSKLLQDELHLGIAAMSKVELFNVGMLAGSIACGTLAKRRGIAYAVVVPSLVMIPLLPLYVGAVPRLLSLGALCAGIIGVGWCGVVPVYLTSLFPMHARAKAVGIVYHVGACFAALIPWVIALLARALQGHTRAPWAWAIGTVAAACELSLAVLLLVQPKDMVSKAPADALADMPGPADFEAPVSFRAAADCRAP